VEFNQVLHERQTKSQSTGSSFRRGVNLGEHLENTIKLIRGNPNAIVFHANQDLMIHLLRRDANPATVLFGELRGVVQQVAKHLHDPRGIHVKIHGYAGQLDVKLALLVKRPDGLARFVDDSRGFHDLPAELDFSSTDAADIEQIVNESDQVIDLVIHHIDGGLHGLSFSLGHSQDAEGVANGRKWISQFMRLNFRKLFAA
jgi:hypothetical protein